MADADCNDGLDGFGECGVDGFRDAARDDSAEDARRADSSDGRDLRDATKTVGEMIFLVYYVRGLHKRPID